jgi:chromosome segregation ATPase
MSMDSVLKRLESRIEELVAAYRTATERVAELEAQVAGLEQRAADGSELEQRTTELEAQRDRLAERLEGVLGLIDEALRASDDGAAGDSG